MVVEDEVKQFVVLEVEGVEIMQESGCLLSIEVLVFSYEMTFYQLTEICPVGLDAFHSWLTVGIITTIVVSHHFPTDID